MPRSLRGCAALTTVQQGSVFGDTGTTRDGNSTPAVSSSRSWERYVGDRSFLVAESHAARCRESRGAVSTFHVLQPCADRDPSSSRRRRSLRVDMDKPMCVTMVVVLGRCSLPPAVLQLRVCPNQLADEAGTGAISVPVSPILFTRFPSPVLRHASAPVDVFLLDLCPSRPSPWGSFCLSSGYAHAGARFS